MLKLQTQVFLTLLLYSGPGFADVVPFSGFFGKYRPIAGVCYRNSVEYTDGCFPDRVELKANDTGSGGKDDIYLLETFPRPTGVVIQRMFLSKVDTGDTFLDAGFTSHSPRHGKWTYVYKTLPDNEERISVEMERTKDGIELTVINLSKTRTRSFRVIRSYFLETLP